MIQLLQALKNCITNHLIYTESMRPTTFYLILTQHFRISPAQTGTRYQITRLNPSVPKSTGLTQTSQSWTVHPASFVFPPETPVKAARCASLTHALPPDQTQCLPLWLCVMWQAVFSLELSAVNASFGDISQPVSLSYLSEPRPGHISHCSPRLSPSSLTGKSP